MVRPRARNNLYTGAQQFADPFTTTTTRYWPDGSVRSNVVATESRKAHHCKRGPYTKNIPYIIQGTSTFWRNMSSYERLVWNVTRGAPTAWTTPLSGGAKTVVTTAAPNYAHMLADIPGFWLLDHVLKDDNLHAMAVTECRRKLADGKANLAVALAEARRTANLLADTSSRLFRALLALRRGNLGGAARALGLGGQRNAGRRLAGTHLQIKYGWGPLMMDIWGSYELLSQQVSRGMFMSKVRTVQDFQQLSKSCYSQYSATQMKEWEVEGGVIREHKCKLVARLTDGLVQTMQQGGLTNPLLLGWELVPFSFVVDWVVPVGNMLEAATALQGLEFVGGYTSVYGEQVVRGKQVPQGNVSGSPREFTIEGFNVVRTGLTSFPSVMPYVRSPFRTSNVLTALALWLQLRR